MNTILNYYNNLGEITTINNYDYCEIELLGKHAKSLENNKSMLISKSDINSMLNFKWYLCKSGYPGTYGTYDNTIQFSCLVPAHRLLFHNELSQLESGLVIDHINRNKLDNRRNNLRICTAKENSYNKTKKGDKYKGIKKITKKKTGEVTYQAIISKDGKRHIISDIATEEEAARMYDAMAEELFGVFASKNLP